MPDLYGRLERAILEADVQKKCDLTAALVEDWRSGSLKRDPDAVVLPIDDPGRPQRPELVDPRQLERRSVATPDGRLRLLHAFAHIEFNAINIALDAAYRFRTMPDAYISDWLRVASEEALHFRLLRETLRQRDSDYGQFPAHSGLWDMVCKTRHDVLHRMALVPRVMEARGLDVTPAMIAKFGQFEDNAAVAILERIYEDEIDHVRIGNRWFNTLCRQRGLDARATFRSLLDDYMGGRLRGPFNWKARLEAGFDSEELEALESAS